MKAVEINDVSDNHLIVTIGDKNDLEILIPITGHNSIKNIRQQLASLLNRIKP